MNADPTPIAADDVYDVYSVMDLVPKIVESVRPADSRFVALLLVFIGVGSAFIGASKDFPLQ